jgi:uncharacterized protein (DUF736 family)
MATIGNVTKTADGFTGNLATISVQCPICFVKNDRKRSDASPDYRIFSAAAEIGAAWDKISIEEKKPYTSGTLAAPELGPRKINFTLGRAADQESDDQMAMIWNTAD